MPASSAFVANLERRVLELAGMARADLPSRGQEILDARVEGLVEARKLSEPELQRVADSLRKQFPRCVSTEPRVYRPVVRSPSPPQLTQSKTPTPGAAGSSAVMRGKPRPLQVAALAASTHSRSSGARKPSAATVTAPPVVPIERNPAPQLASPPRVSVQRKRQAAAADAEYVEAMERELEAHAEAERRQQEQRAEVRERMRRDMQDHAQRVAQREREAREERQRKRQQVIAETEAVHLDDAVARDRRKRKLAQEKAEIERQREARRAAHEAEQRRAAEDNARYRREAEEGLKLDAEIAERRRVETRLALVDFLNESKQALEERRRQQEAERERIHREAMQTASPFLLGDATKDETTGRLPGMSEKAAVKVAARKRKQDAVRESHAAHAEERAKAARQLEEAALAAEQRTAAEMHRRNEAERAKAQQMRAALVASLDQELSIHQQRKAAEEAEKRRLREAADAEARASDAAQRAKLEAQRKEQERLRTQLAAQINEREAGLATAAQRIKITQRGNRFLPLNTSPAV